MVTPPIIDCLQHANVEGEDIKIWSMEPESRLTASA